MGLKRSDSQYQKKKSEIKILAMFLEAHYGGKACGKQCWEGTWSLIESPIPEAVQA